MRSTASPEQTDVPESRRRYVPKAAFVLVDRMKQLGVSVGLIGGPWRGATHALERPGRGGLNAIPLVTNGETEVMVDTMEHAIDLAGLLNWCGVQRLDPVPDLTPPQGVR